MKKPETLMPKQEARLQTLKRLDLKTAQAYGFKHVGYLRTIIYLVAGLLTCSMHSK